MACSLLGHLYNVSVHQEDFMLRRRMLLKRLDVTLQSFLWADKAQGTLRPTLTFLYPHS